MNEWMNEWMNEILMSRHIYSNRPYVAYVTSYTKKYLT